MEKSYMARESAFDTVKDHYRTIENKKLYEEYAIQFNSREDNEEIDILVEDVFRTAGYEYVYAEANEEERKYFRIAFVEFFHRASTNNVSRKAVSRDVLIDLCYKQNFTCPFCGGKLDPDIKSGPLKVVADHCTAISKIGDNKETLKQLYGENAIKLAAIHQHCNNIKGDKAYLSGYVEKIKK